MAELKRYKVLFTTNVGSHMWGMQHKGSDVDLFKCFQMPSDEILLGKQPYSEHARDGRNDIAYHEVGVVVDQLLKNNVNFLWGVLSPRVIQTEDEASFLRLRALARKNLSKLAYHSIHGLASHNYEKYIASGKSLTEKRCNTIVRTLKFGINLLATGDAKFEAVSGSRPADVRHWMGQLEQALSDSRLPEKPTHGNQLRDWLLKLRVRDVQESHSFVRADKSTHSSHKSLK